MEEQESKTATNAQRCARGRRIAETRKRFDLVEGKSTAGPSDRLPSVSLSLNPDVRARWVNRERAQGMRSQAASGKDLDSHASRVRRAREEKRDGRGWMEGLDDKTEVAVCRDDTSLLNESSEELPFREESRIPVCLD